MGPVGHFDASPFRACASKANEDEDEDEDEDSSSSYEDESSSSYNEDEDRRGGASASKSPGLAGAGFCRRVSIPEVFVDVRVRSRNASTRVQSIAQPHTTLHTIITVLFMSAVCRITITNRSIRATAIYVVFIFF